MKVKSTREPGAAAFGEQESWQRSGFTLVEVIAGAALLGTLLVSVMLGFSKHVRQYQNARLRIQAAELLDRQLLHWHSEGESLPADREGILSSEPPLVWRTTLIQDRSAARMNSVIVRLEVFHPDPRKLERPLITVEQLQPLDASTQHQPIEE